MQLIVKGLQSPVTLLLNELLYIDVEMLKLCYTANVLIATGNGESGAVLSTAINPHTGQLDYSAAWADYYRQQGMHQHAQAILQAASGQIPQWKHRFYCV